MDTIELADKMIDCVWSDNWSALQQYLTEPNAKEAVLDEHAGVFRAAVSCDKAAAVQLLLPFVGLDDIGWGISMACAEGATNVMRDLFPITDAHSFIDHRCLQWTSSHLLRETERHGTKMKAYQSAFDFLMTLPHDFVNTALAYVHSDYDGILKHEVIALIEDRRASTQRAVLEDSIASNGAQSVPRKM